MAEDISGKSAPSRAVIAVDAFTIDSWDRANEVAKMMAQSDLVPAQDKGKPANILIKMAWGSQLHLPWITAVQSIVVLDGHATLTGDIGLALVRHAVSRTGEPLLEEIEETWDDKTQTATCMVKRRGDPKPHTRKFSMRDAERIQVWYHDKTDGGKLKSYSLAKKKTYQSYPARMCQFRARWYCLRDVFADVLMGIVGYEEYDELRDITPEPEEKSQPQQFPQPRSTDEQKADNGEPEGPQ